MFDVLRDKTHFSYRSPPSPHFSIVMMAPAATCLPPLDDILDLALAVAPQQQQHSSSSSGDPSAASPSNNNSSSMKNAAGENGKRSAGLPDAATIGVAGEANSTAAAAAAAGAGSDGGHSGSSGRVSYAAVKIALPEEGDVGFVELVPMRLMNLLTNT
jgi:hypothetical protein